MPYLPTVTREYGIFYFRNDPDKGRLSKPVLVELNLPDSLEYRKILHASFKIKSLIYGVIRTIMVTHKMNARGQDDKDHKG